MSAASPPAERRGAPLLAVVAAVFVLTGRPVGLAAAAGLVVAWWVLPLGGTVAFGQIGVAAIAPAAGVPALVVAEAGLFGLLANAIGWRPRGVAALILGTAALVAVGVGAFVATDALAWAALAVVVTVAVASYALDRLTRFRLGVLDSG